jgi:glycosyltransferase EpsD
MEAMASGLPMVVTNCRGNRQLVAHEKNGYVVEINDIGTFCQGVEKLQQSEELRNTFGKFNLEAIQRYDIKQVVRQMKAIYRKVLVE